MFFQDNQALCQVRDVWGWSPLHCACYQNAPLGAIWCFIGIWPQAMGEVVTLHSPSTGVLDTDCTALEIVVDVSVPDEVISFLAQTTHQLHLQVSHWPLDILMDMNHNIDLVKTVLDEREWTKYEHLFCPQKERLYHKQAFYHLHNNDPDLEEVCVGWPLPSEYALESVVEALSCNTTVYRLDIREGDTNLYPEPTEMS